MTAFTKVLAGGVAIAALAAAAPASAQYYPGYGSPYGYGSGNVVGQVINQVLGGGYGGYGGYGNYGGGYAGNSQAAVGQCVGAVQQRLNGGFGAYGNSGAYGYNGYGGNARVLGISRVEPRGGGGLTVRGVATSGAYGGAYGGGYGGAYGAQQQPVDLTFRCRTDYRGFVTSVSVDRAQPNYGANYGSTYTPYANDYSQYGYRRY